jgi:uncharacterized protein YecT (DUF1311 family)
MKSKLLFSMTCLLFAFYGNAQEEEKHPLEVKSDACYEKAVSTADMIVCADANYTAWDKELNKVYKALLKKMDKSNEVKLRESQRAWILYRDAALKYNEGAMDKMEGTMWNPIRIERVVKVIRDRSLFLQRYLEDLEMN